MIHNETDKPICGWDLDKMGKFKTDILVNFGTLEYVTVPPAGLEISRTTSSPVRPQNGQHSAGVPNTVSVACEHPVGVTSFAVVQHVPGMFGFGMTSRHWYSTLIVQVSPLPYDSQHE